MTPDEITKMVFSTEGLDFESRKQPARFRKDVQGRQRAMYLIKYFHPTMSYKDIGLMFGRDHATAIHACNKVTNFIATEKWYAQQMGVYILRIRRQISVPLHNKGKEVTYRMLNRRAILCKTAQGYVITLKRLRDSKVETRSISLSDEAMNGIIECYNTILK